MPAPTLAMSATARPLSMRMRPDLELRAVRMRGRPQWSVKDPLALRYFQLREEEYFILRMLDGQTSIDEIQKRFERRFAPLRLEPRRLQAFLGRLHEEGLLLADPAGQGSELLRRRGKLRRQKWIEMFSNVLALQFRGVDPDSFLRRIEPWTRWIYSRTMALLCVLLTTAALLLVAVHFDTLKSRLPEFRAFFGAGNLLWLAVAIGVVKVMHEIGHALTCRHFGGRCHELGFMLLVFTPCLYCNVSDAWLLADKWRRIAISAAGIVVEVMVASAATFVWWFSGTGLVNSLSLDLMFVCSVNTVLLNGNPLLRYDGYYILSDLVEVPNLQQQASSVLRRWLARYAAGAELVEDRLLPDRGHGWLALYAIASTLYRCMVVVLILWFLHKVLGPYGLDPLVQIIGLAAVGAMVAMPAVAGVRFLRHQQRRDEAHWGRLAMFGGLTLVALAAILSIPLPHRVAAPLVLEPAGAARVYVDVPGTLHESVKAGDVVRTGQILARLENREMELEIAELQGEVDSQTLHLQNLMREQGGDSVAAAEIPTAQKALADLKERLKRRLEDRQRLTLAAPRAGTVLPPREQSPETPPGQLPSWSETPLDRRNLGAYLQTGTPFCLVGNPDQLEAVAVVDQADVDFVHVGARAAIKLDELPNQTLHGTVAAVAQIDLQVAPRELAERGDLPSRADASGTVHPLETAYQARITLDEQPLPLRSRAAGRAKIDAPSQSLGARLWRSLEGTFQFHW
jgi:putative peptide zinc metalloprotease protein